MRPVTTLLHKLVRSFHAEGVTETAAAAHAVRKELEKRAARGDIEAEQMLDDSLNRGLQGRVKDILKEERIDVPVKTGKVVNIKQTWGVRKGRKWQQMRLWGMDYDTLADLVQRESDRLKGQSHTLGALRTLLRVYDEHRDAPTVADALRAEGIDPESLVVWGDA